MSETIAEMRARAAGMRESATKYRMLAESRRAAGDIPIADKLMEFVLDLEARAQRIEVMLRAVSAYPEASLSAAA